jgi:hypothetical protein
MLNLDETVIIKLYYLVQKDTIIRIFGYLFGIFSIIEIIRNQVPEIYLLQLVPGYYIFLLVLFFIIFLNITQCIVQIYYEIDIKKAIGTKTFSRLQYIILGKIGFALTTLGLYFIYSNLLPLSLDEFNSYGEKALEDTWTFLDVLNLEVFLLISLTLILQVPLYPITKFNNEKDSNLLPQYWKGLSLFTFIFSGVLTPTVDGYTQFCFASSGLSLYLMIIAIVLKRVSIKFSAVLNLG